MKAEQILNLKVIEVARGSEVGKVSGLLIDADEKKVQAIAVSGGGLLAHSRYIPLQNVIAVEHDVMTVPTQESLVERRNFRAGGLLESLTNKKVLTQDGRELGVIRTYGFDPKSGDLEYITFGVNKQVLGGLWRSAGDSYDIPATYIRALGDHVVVDNSVPDIVGMSRAA